MDAGLSVARINFSHSTHDQHAATIALVRETAKSLGRPVGILGDLQGPRIRVGELPNPLQLEDGSDLVLAPENTVRPNEIPVTYETLAADVHVGDRILINDGLIELVVLEVAPPRVTARVLHGGKLSSHKGINLPGVSVSAPSRPGPPGPRGASVCPYCSSPFRGHAIPPAHQDRRHARPREHEP